MTQKKTKQRSKKEGAPKQQHERFVAKARELSADESGEAFERAFQRIVPPKSSKQNSS